MTTRERAIETYQKVRVAMYNHTLPDQATTAIEQAITAAVEEKDARIAELETENAELRQRLNRLVELGHTSAS